MLEDPDEKNDISRDNATITEELTDRLLDVVEENRACFSRFSGGKVSSGESQDIIDLKNRLKAIGYIK